MAGVALRGVNGRFEDVEVDIIVGVRKLPKSEMVGRPNVISVNASPDQVYTIQVKNNRAYAIVCTATVDGQRVLLRKEDFLPVWPGKTKWFEGFVVKYHRSGQKREKSHREFKFAIARDGGGSGNDNMGQINVKIWERDLIPVPRHDRMSERPMEPLNAFIIKRTLMSDGVGAMCKTKEQAQQEHQSSSQTSLVAMSAMSNKQPQQTQHSSLQSSVVVAMSDISSFETAGDDTKKQLMPMVVNDPNECKMENASKKNSSDGPKDFQEQGRTHKLCTKAGAMKTMLTMRHEDSSELCEKPVKGKFLNEIKIHYWT